MLVQVHRTEREPALLGPCGLIEFRDVSLARHIELLPQAIRFCPRRSHRKRRQIEQRQLKLHRILARCMHQFLDDNIGLLTRDYGGTGAVALCGPA
jgi:hypothetical protein